MTEQTAAELLTLLKDQRKFFETQMNFYESVIKKLIDQTLQNTTLDNAEDSSKADSNLSRDNSNLYMPEENWDESDEEVSCYTAPKYIKMSEKLSEKCCYADEEEYGGEDIDVEYFDRDEYLSEEYAESIREMSKSENDSLLKYERSDKHYFLD